MADRTIKIRNLPFKIHDNGDSTYSLVAHLETDVDLNAGDIEIGAVELKDGATDTRAKIKSDGTDNAVVVMQNAPPTGSATSANQTTGNNSLSSIDTKLSGTGAVKDNGPAWTSSYGIGSPPARFTSADASAAPANVTEAPTSGQKLVITDLIISVDADLVVSFKEETSGTVLLTLYMARNSTLQVTLRGKLKLATANKKLQVQTDTTGEISVLAGYYSEA